MKGTLLRHIIRKFNWHHAIFLMLFLIGPNVMCSAQESRANSQQDDIPNLIAELKDRDERVVVKAAEMLVEAGSAVVPTLIKFLDDEKKCLPRLLAAGVIYKLDPKNGAVVPALTGVVRGKCTGENQKALLVRRQAAFALGTTAQGIQELTGLLKDEDIFVRRSAAFAFDELTERLDGRPPEIIVTPEIIATLKSALPTLGEALNDKDEVVRGMSSEALEQIQRSKHQELRSAANMLLQ